MNFSEPLNLKFVLALALLLLFPANKVFAANIENTPNSQTIKLFLPIKSQLFPDMIIALKNDLHKNNINNLRIEGIDHWHAYQQGLRAGRVGFYFAPPHFTAWAFSEFNFKPMLRLSEPLSYVIATMRANSELFEINDLIGKLVCSEKPFSLSYLLSGSESNTQLGSSNIEIVESVEEEMTNPETHCDAFSISDHLFKKVSVKLPTRYIRLHQSVKFNNYALIAHPEIDEEQIAALTAYFLKNETQDLIAPMLQQYSQSGNLLLSKTTDYPSTYWQILTAYWKK